MGDKPTPFEPKHKIIRDDVIGKSFASCCMRECPHPKVIQRFGLGGVANVSYYTCKRCKFHREHPLHFGVSCEYGLEKGVRPGEKN